MVRRTIDTLGRPYGNAYIVAAANAILPSVPLENLAAMIQACHE
jgi:uroporphyrinogen-III decarboxylase